jgi:8-oxo-dGTP pyrophosphatase MutT (NUDIX family)
LCAFWRAIFEGFGCFLCSYGGPMDFRTKTNEYSFGVRVSALMIEDDKIYLAKSPNDEYYLLGGAIFVNELTKDAIRREIKEEVGADSEVGSLACVRLSLVLAD